MLVLGERGAQARVHGAGVTGVIECRYYGRDFTADEMALLRALIAADPQPTRAALSREFCRRIGWFKPDGGLKDMMAKVTMLAMHRDGVITLPPPRGPEEAGRKHRWTKVPEAGILAWECSRCWVSRHGIVPLMAVRSVPTFPCSTLPS